MKYLPFIGGAAIAPGIWIRPALHTGKKAIGDSTYTLHEKVDGLDTGWVFLYHPGDRPTEELVH